MTSVSTLIVDSGVFIKRIPLQDFSARIITVPEVFREIRDKATRDYVNVLPYKIDVLTPSDEHILRVQEFARLTGDLRSLSSTDLKLIALVRQLSVEAKLEVRNVPTDHGVWKPDDRYHDVASVPGFYIPKDQNNRSRDLSTSQGVPSSTVGDDESDREPSLTYCEEESGTGCTIVEDDGDDDDGWITAESLNLTKISLDSNAADTEYEAVSVACMTFDFAIQNVLLQLGLHIISPMKMLIKEARSYALRCAGCFKISTNTEKLFCPNCGHKSLEKATVSTDSNGQKTYTLLRRRPLSMKGMRFSLPTPKGGKYAHNPVLIDGQPGPQQRASAKARSKLDALDIDFVARQSPFSFRDTTSRAAELGYNSSGRRGPKEYWERRNPNVVMRKKK